MTVTFPLAKPSLPGIRSNAFQMRTQAARTESPFSFSAQVQLKPAERWEGRCELPPMKEPRARAWKAWLAALRGGLGTFVLGDPDYTALAGTGSGTPVVAGAGQAGIVLATDGWDPAQTVLRAGDYIQLGSGSVARLHLILQDVISDSGGNADLDIWPRIRETPDDGDPLTLTNPVGIFRLASNVSGWDADQTGIHRISFDIVEAL